MKEKDDGKKGKKSKKSGDVVIHKTKQVRRKRNGPKSSLQAICRAINLSARPDITKGLLFPTTRGARSEQELRRRINARLCKNED